MENHLSIVLAHLKPTYLIFGLIQVTKHKGVSGIMSVSYFAEFKFIK